MSSSLAYDLQTRPLKALVLGGSAGGIDALRTLLPTLPAGLAVPVCVVLHIAADAKTAWPSVFSECALPVVEAEDKQQAQAGYVYVAPADYHLLIDAQGTLSLSLDPPVNLSRPAIDVLFESAAWAFGANLLGVVLSGANADGAAGLRAIADAGGLCWVQAPQAARATAMPKAALAAVPEARAATLAEMAAAFSSLATK